jgi:hypothetical protein
MDQSDPQTDPCWTEAGVCRTFSVVEVRAFRRRTDSTFAVVGA